MTDVDTVKLKPCPNPWCAEDRKPIIIWDLYSRRVVCPCGVKGPRSQTKANTTQGVPINDKNRDVAEVEAICAWNTRTIAALPPAVPATTPDPAESHVDGWRVRVIEWATDETVKVVQCKGEREAEKIERGMSMNMASEYYTEVDNKPRTITTTPDPVAEAAKVLLANMPSPVFDDLKPVLMGEFGVTVEGCDEDGEECHYIEPIGWATIKDILSMAVRALTKDGEAG